LFAQSAPTDAPETAASERANIPKAPAVQIRVREGGWGEARVEDIEAVLNSVAAILLEHFPSRRLNPIVVTHSSERPITLYRKAPGNAYQVQLSAKDDYWPRYAYEFAHELSHILMNYDHHADARATAFNQWFEESLCEAASLYALKRLAFTWEVRPPQPQWASYAPEFERYVERFLNERHRQLPPDVKLAEWFRQNEQTLRETPYLRDRNEIVANLMLPLFEENDALWESIGYLNLEPKATNFRGYLQTWHDNAPDEYKDTIRYIMALFGTLASPAETAARDAPVPSATRTLDAGVAGPGAR
jgi:hypothetical protein